MGLYCHTIDEVPWELTQEHCIEFWLQWHKRRLKGPSKRAQKKGLVQTTHWHVSENVREWLSSDCDCFARGQEGCVIAK